MPSRRRDGLDLTLRDRSSYTRAACPARAGAPGRSAARCDACSPSRRRDRDLGGRTSALRRAPWPTRSRDVTVLKRARTWARSCARPSLVIRCIGTARDLVRADSRVKTSVSSRRGDEHLASTRACPRYTPGPLDSPCRQAARPSCSYRGCDERVQSRRARLLDAAYVSATPSGLCVRARSSPLRRIGTARCRSRRAHLLRVVNRDRIHTAPRGVPARRRAADRGVAESPSRDFARDRRTFPGHSSRLWASSTTTSPKPVADPLRPRDPLALSRPCRRLVANCPSRAAPTSRMYFSGPSPLIEAPWSDKRADTPHRAIAAIATLSCRRRRSGSRRAGRGAPRRERLAWYPRSSASTIRRRRRWPGYARIDPHLLSASRR